MNLYSLIKPFLFALPPEVAHHFSLNALKMYANVLKNKQSRPTNPQNIQLMGLNFPNRVGLAAGLDKSGAYIDALATLGFGFIEIGTITPEAQQGNPKPRLFRLRQAEALINRMGFNNPGIATCLKNIQSRRYQGILGINIGKGRQTPIDQALDDYLTCFQAFYPYASYITVNISSPNTPELRNLQRKDALNHLLDALKNEQTRCQQHYQRKVPLVVKVAPDLSAEDIHEMATLFLQYDIDGMIATNTTQQRQFGIHDCHLHEAGGLSGAPIHALSVKVIQQFYTHLQNRIPIIGVGGINSAAACKQTLDAGAKLVQLYTGLIYQGPALVQACCNALANY